MVRPFEQWQRDRAKEKELITQMIDQDHLCDKGTGITKVFEEAFANYIGCKYALAFDHGTSALTAAYYAVGVRPGTAVATPAVGWLQSYAGALHLGAKIHFIDIDEETLLLDPEKIPPEVEVINNIHLNGRINDLEKLTSKGVPLVDDASHVTGASFQGKKIGNANHITCFSMQGVAPGGKPLSCGEGGVACTNDKKLYQALLAYGHIHRHGLQKMLQDSPYGELDKGVLGLKMRPHPFATALALLSLQTLDERNKGIQKTRKQIEELLRPYPHLSLPRSSPLARLGGHFGALHIHLEGRDCGKFVFKLQEEGLPATGPTVGTLEYKRALCDKAALLPSAGSFAKGSYPIAEEKAKSVFTLPLFVNPDPHYFALLKGALEKIHE